MTLKTTVAAGLIALTGAVATAVAAQSGLSLLVNRTVVSNDVRLINGRPYVPLADVAQAYHQTLVKKPGGYELVAAGGAGEVGDKYTARLGQELFTGQWRFKVVSVGAPSDLYTPRYEKEAKPIKPVGANDMLIVVNCRVKNGMKDKRRLGVGTGDYNVNTALTDSDEHVYTPVAYDLPHDKEYYEARGASILPGAAEDVTLVFSVPKGTKPQSLIFSLMTWDTTYMDTKHHTDVRVTLAP